MISPADFPPNFKAAEFLAKAGPAKTPGGPGTPIPWEKVPRFVQKNLHALAWKLQSLRDVELGGRPVTITSGYRSPVRNREVGGAQGSKHMSGQAVDITVQGLTPREVQRRLSLWNGGLGLAASFTHVDTGPRRRWTY
jgi:uncharacterized protein YcbK (DUF882 family)